MSHSNEKPGWLMLLPWKISNGVAAGGVNQVVLNLYDEMDRVGDFKPYIVEDDWESPIAQNLEVNGRRLVSFRHRVPLGGIKEFIMFCLLLPLSLIRTYKAIKERNVKVINAHYPSLAVINYLILRKLGVLDFRIILSVHGRDIRDVSEYEGLQKKIYHYIYTSADSVVACSQGLLDDVCQIVEVKPGRQGVVHNGINSDDYRAIAGKAKIDYEPGSYILNIGTYEHKKGHDILLKAFQLVSRKNPGIKLVVAGRYTEYFEQTSELLKSLELENKVDLLSNLEHQTVAGLLKHSKLFVLPSRNEGFAISLLEAGALAKPVVAMDVCGVAELINHGEDGFLVESEDFESFADQITALLDAPAHADAFADKLNQKVSGKYSWTAAVNKYQDLALSLME